MKPDIEKLRLSGRISATVREHCKTMIEPGARLEHIARTAEDMIRDLGGEPAFPAQLSRNHIAATTARRPTTRPRCSPTTS